MPIVGLTTGPDSVIRPIIDTNGRVQVVEQSRPEENLKQAEVAGNATQTCGSSGEIWQVLSAVYTELSAATPNIYLHDDTNTLALTDAYDATLGARNQLMKDGQTAAVDGAAVLKVPNGAAGDTWNINAIRRG